MNKDMTYLDFGESRIFCWKAFCVKYAKQGSHHIYYHDDFLNILMFDILNIDV